MTERSWVQSPTMETILPMHGKRVRLYYRGIVKRCTNCFQQHQRKFCKKNSATIHLDQSLQQKLWKTLTWHCCMCCNPANGRVDFVELSAYKIQLEWIVSLSADWDQSPKKKIIIIMWVILFCFRTCLVYLGLIWRNV